MQAHSSVAQLAAPTNYFHLSADQTQSKDTSIVCLSHLRDTDAHHPKWLNVWKFDMEFFSEKVHKHSPCSCRKFQHFKSMVQLFSISGHLELQQYVSQLCLGMIHSEEWVGKVAFMNMFLVWSPIQSSWPGLNSASFQLYATPPLLSSL